MGIGPEGNDDLDPRETPPNDDRGTSQVKPPAEAAMTLAPSVYHQPAVDGFRDLQVIHPGGTISPLAFPDVEVDIAELFE